MAATANTNVSDRTPPPSGLIGTGKRSARVAAAVRAASPTSSRPLWPVVANSYPAATRTPRPAMQTGKMRAASRRGVTAVEVTSAPLPGQLVDRFPGELPERDRNEHDQGHQEDQPGLPLQHPEPPHQKDARPRDSLACDTPRDPPCGGFAQNAGLRGGKAGFGERAAGPREACGVPTRELGDGDAVLRGMDEPAVPEVDRHVVHLARLRPGAASAEEEDVR